VSWLVEPHTTLSAGASWAVQRFAREENVTTHTPRLGMVYRFTETATASHFRSWPPSP